MSDDEVAFWGCGVESIRRNSVLVQHAVRTDGMTAWCGVTVQPVLIDDWHVPFVPDGSTSCKECARRYRQAFRWRRKFAFQEP